MLANTVLRREIHSVARLLCSMVLSRKTKFGLGVRFLLTGECPRTELAGHAAVLILTRLLHIILAQPITARLVTALTNHRPPLHRLQPAQVPDEMRDGISLWECESENAGLQGTACALLLLITPTATAAMNDHAMNFIDFVVWTFPCIITFWSKDEKLAREKYIMYVSYVLLCIVGIYHCNLIISLNKVYIPVNC